MSKLMIKNESSQAVGTEKVRRKGEITRERILAAARKVFARHSYHAGSIRMIAREGGFDHGIIRYHFASKAELFEALNRNICEEFITENIKWLEGLTGMSPREGLSLYLDRLLAYNFNNPDALRIVCQNMPQADNPERIPGYHYIPELLSETRRYFVEKMKLNIDPGELGMIFDTFNLVVVGYVGASSCQAYILGLDPNGPEYRRWVKVALLKMFGPHLDALFASNPIGEKGGTSR